MTMPDPPLSVNDDGELLAVSAQRVASEGDVTEVLVELQVTKREDAAMQQSSAAPIRALRLGIR